MSADLEQIRAIIRQEFKDFRQEVFQPYCNLNSDEHKEIFRWLRLLNGWRNKLLGAGALIGFAAPATIAVWAVLQAQ